MSVAWRLLARGATRRWSVWKFNWLANHKLIAALEHARIHARGVLLDVGCGSKPFAALFTGRVERYLGTDLSHSTYLGRARLDAFARAEALPLRGGTVDTVLALSMITYLPEPLAMLKEAHRVLRPGGVAIVEFAQMAPVAGAPHDYFRFTRYGAQYLLERAGFEVIEVMAIGGLWARVGLSMIAGLNRINRGPTRVISEIPVRLLYVMLQLSFELLDRLFHDSGEVLAHLVVARRRG